MTSPLHGRTSSRSRIFAVVVLIASVFVLCFSAALQRDARSLGPVSMLTGVRGEVVVRHASGELVPAREGDLLVAGDAIRTGSGGTAELTSFDGSSMRLDTDAQLVVEMPSNASDSGNVAAMRQTATRTWQVITELLSGSSRYELRTPSSTASVRG